MERTTMEMVEIYRAKTLGGEKYSDERLVELVDFFSAYLEICRKRGYYDDEIGNFYDVPRNGLVLYELEKLEKRMKEAIISFKDVKITMKEIFSKFTGTYGEEKHTYAKLAEHYGASKNTITHVLHKAMYKIYREFPIEMLVVSIERVSNLNRQFYSEVQHVLTSKSLHDVEKQEHYRELLESRKFLETEMEILWRNLSDANAELYFLEFTAEENFYLFELGICTAHDVVSFFDKEILFSAIPKEREELAYSILHKLAHFGMRF